jgi:hypothetical protein
LTHRAWSFNSDPSRQAGSRRYHFPHAEAADALLELCRAEIDDEAKIQITYFTSGITWSADYICIARQGREADEL